MKSPLLSFLFVFIATTAVPCFSQPADGNPQVQSLDEIRSVAPNVYLDCNRRDCDFEYIKTEITFVNYITNRQNADVHIIVTRERTGSGGSEYTLSFIGLKNHKGKDATLKYFSKPTDTADQIRKGFTNILKQGLIPYVYDTPLSEFISISYARRENVPQTQPQDKWNYWVFSVGLRGNGDFEQNQRRYSYSVTLSANRTTEDLKFRFYANTNINERRYKIEEETIVSLRKRKSLSTSLIKSLSGHWSFGGFMSLYASSYDNAKLYTSLAPAIEYNVFPYSEATRRELRIQYRLGLSMRQYEEVTLYDKEQEVLAEQSLQATLELKEPWGSAGFLVAWSNYFHDFSKNNFRAQAGIWVNVLKGLSFNVGGEYSRVRDQLSLPMGGASYEEILLELTRLATTYELSFEVGFNFRFGSIYSNVVNPRFGNR